MTHLNTPFCARAFWDFSVELYAQSPTQDCCLALQNAYQCNVNVLLLCAWLENQSLSLTVDAVFRLTKAIDDSDQDLKRFRLQRAALKPQPERYKQALEQELEMEKRQQQILIDTLNQLLLKGSLAENPLDSFARSYQLTEDVVHHFIHPIKRIVNTPS